MTVYKTENYNFDTIVYVGEDFEAAKAAAVESGFEAIIFTGERGISDPEFDLFAVYSPVYGMQIKKMS